MVCRPARLRLCKDTSPATVCKVEFGLPEAVAAMGDIYPINS